VEPPTNEPEKIDFAALSGGSFGLKPLCEAYASIRVPSAEKPWLDNSRLTRGSRSRLIGNVPPSLTRCCGIGLQESLADRGDDYGVLALGNLRQVRPAAPYRGGPRR
jgi:hypothetical protein